MLAYRLEKRAVRTDPPLRREFRLQLLLTFGEIRGIGETVDLFGPVRIAHPKLEAVSEIEHLEPNVLATPFEPPEHI